MKMKAQLATYLLTATVLLNVVAYPTLAQERDYTPVTDAMLLNPDPADWLMINRTFDEQRFSPLDQINRENVGQLSMAWARGLPRGVQETTPIVSDGVMYLVQPGAGVLAIDATNGDQLWEYWRAVPEEAVDYVNVRTKNIAIYSDLIFYPAPDGYLVALDVRTGQVRWETKVFPRKSHSRFSAWTLFRQ